MKGACGPLSSLLLALPLLSLVLVLLSLLYSLLLFCAAVACSGLPHKRERAPRARDFLTTSLYLSGRACGRFLLLFLVLFLVTSVLSLVLVLAPPAVRCRCALETSSHPRGGAAGSRQPRNLVFFFFFFRGVWPRRGARQRASTGTLLDDKGRAVLVLVPPCVSPVLAAAALRCCCVLGTS